MSALELYGFLKSIVLLPSFCQGHMFGSIFCHSALEIQIDNCYTARDTVSTPPHADERSHGV
jgi:hypothetical protein